METINTLSARSLQYYVIAKHWVSDLEFFRIEAKFFNTLIDENLRRVKVSSGNNALRALLYKINKLNEDEQATAKMLAEQLQQLELMAEDIIPENIDDVKGQQVQLEYLVANLIHEYRAVKREIFTTIESFLKENQRLSV